MMRRRLLRRSQCRWRHPMCRRSRADAAGAGTAGRGADAAEISVRPGAASGAAAGASAATNCMKRPRRPCCRGSFETARVRRARDWVDLDRRACPLRPGAGIHPSVYVTVAYINTAAGLLLGRQTTCCSRIFTIAFNPLSLRVKTMRELRASWSGTMRARNGWPGPKPPTRFDSEG